MLYNFNCNNDIGCNGKTKKRRREGKHGRKPGQQFDPDMMGGRGGRNPMGNEAWRNDEWW